MSHSILVTRIIYINKVMLFNCFSIPKNLVFLFWRESKQSPLSILREVNFDCHIISWLYTKLPSTPKLSWNRSHKVQRIDVLVETRMTNTKCIIKHNKMFKMPSSVSANMSWCIKCSWPLGFSTVQVIKNTLSEIKFVITLGKRSCLKWS